MTVSEMSETETTSSPHQKQHWLAEQMLRWSGLLWFATIWAERPKADSHQPELR